MRLAINKKLHVTKKHIVIVTTMEKNSEKIENWLKNLGFHYFVDPELQDYNALVIDIKPRVIIYFSNDNQYVHIMTLLLPIKNLTPELKQNIYKSLLVKNAEWNLMKFVIMFNTVGIKIDFDLDALSQQEFTDGFKVLAVAYEEYKKIISTFMKKDNDMVEAMFG